MITKTDFVEIPKGASYPDPVDGPTLNDSQHVARFRYFIDGRKFGVSIRHFVGSCDCAGHNETTMDIALRIANETGTVVQVCGGPFGTENQPFNETWITAIPGAFVPQKFVIDSEPGSVWMIYSKSKKGKRRTAVEELERLLNKAGVDVTDHQAVKNTGLEVSVEDRSDTGPCD